MPPKQGDLSLLNDPVAQELLHAAIPARLAYNWKDGTPRVVPIAYHWNGQEIVICSPDAAPKNKVINNSKVALTIDSNTSPFKVLLIRGTAHVEEVTEPPQEYALACIQLMGEQAATAWLQGMAPLLPNIKYFTRIKITPEWVGLMNFTDRFPVAIHKAMEPAV